MDQLYQEPYLTFLEPSLNLEIEKNVHVYACVCVSNDKMLRGT